MTIVMAHRAAANHLGVGTWPHQLLSMPGSEMFEQPTKCSRITKMSIRDLFIERE
jgi:hypothetical protein